MAKNSAVVLFCGLFCITALFVRCSSKVAGVETTNGCTVVATASAIEGTAPALSRAFIFDSQYIPYIDSGFGIGTATDEQGKFRCPASPGSYNILVIDPSGNAASISITAPAATRGSTVSEHKQLYRPGAVSGTVSTAGRDTLLVFLQGMCQYQVILADRIFRLTNVPEGSYTLKMARLSGTAGGKLVEIVHEESVTVSQGQTVSIGTIGY